MPAAQRQAFDVTVNGSIIVNGHEALLTAASDDAQYATACKGL